MLPGRVLAPATPRCRDDCGVLLEHLAELVLADMSEFLLDADLAQTFVGLRVELEGFGVQVHLCIEEVKQSVFDIFNALVFKVLDFGHLGFDLLDNLYRLFQRFEALWKVA